MHLPSGFDRQETRAIESHDQVAVCTLPGNGGVLKQMKFMKFKWQYHCVLSRVMRCVLPDCQSTSNALSTFDHMYFRTCSTTRWRQNWCPPCPRRRGEEVACIYLKMAVELCRASCICIYIQASLKLFIRTCRKSISSSRRCRAGTNFAVAWWHCT
jgi:hypothetical protein